MPNISVIERSTSAPILVSDASVADPQRDFKRYSPAKNETTEKSTGYSCSTKDSPRTCVSRDSPRTCARRHSSKTCACRESPKSCARRNSPRTCACKASPRTCSRRDFPRTCSRRDSPRDFFKHDSSRSCCRIESPRKYFLSESPRRCLRNWSPSKACEELYFNDEAKTSGGSSPRDHCVNECPNNIMKDRGPCPAGVMTIKDEKHQSCGVIEDSGATCSLGDSTNATSDSSASYYQNKLLATQQILQNKEDTIGVQADSLAVAEERIATLNERTNELKKELDRKTKEYATLRKNAECCKVVEKNDVCVVTDRPMNQRDIVNTLENNLCVIEDLYRECFYETAKQDNLIEMLRDSYLDLRLMDRQKADQIGRLQTVINTQKWSLDRCQDIALEVDSLKMEISNFLNNSTSTNNDSGMWERSEESLVSAPGVQDDLQDVMEQLMRLQNILALGCTCGLNEENIKLKQEVASLEIKMGELRGQLRELEDTLASKKDNDLKYKAELESKEKELSLLRDQLIRSQESSRDQSCTCDAITMQMRHTKVLLDEKTTEMSQLYKENQSQAEKIKELQEELKKADHIITENCKMRSEVTYLTKQASLWRAQLEQSERRVHALENQLLCMQACYRQKARSATELQSQLEAARARGAALCGDSRRAVRDVRLWLRRMRDKHRDQENLIKEKDTLLAALQQRLQDRQSETQHTTVSENAASYSKCPSSRDERSFCSKMGIIRVRKLDPGTNEIASCSSTPAPIRLLKKKQYADKRCKTWMCDAGMQQPTRRDAGSEPERDARLPRLSLDRTPRDVSPTEELLLRVEKLSEALADGNRRWTRSRDPR